VFILFKKIKTLVILFLLTNALFLSTSSAKAYERWFSPDYLLDSFVNIALKNEYSAYRGGVRKWVQPVRYYFEHHVADRDLHEALTTLHLRQLSEISGVKFHRVHKRQHANLLIVFSTEKRLESGLQHEFGIRSTARNNQLFRNSVCLAYFSTNARGSINKAFVMIPVDRARAHAKLVSCIVEELTQIMGLPNDSEKVFPSIFNDKSYNQLLTGLDYLLLKMLYHPQVKAGMKEGSLRTVLKRVINEFERDGIIVRAQERASDSGLYRLLN